MQGVAFLHRESRPNTQPNRTTVRANRRSIRRLTMAKEELIKFEGLVTEILPDARYRVQLDAGTRSSPTPPAR